MPVLKQSSLKHTSHNPQNVLPLFTNVYTCTNRCQMKHHPLSFSWQVNDMIILRDKLVHGVWWTSDGLLLFTLRQNFSIEQKSPWPNSTALCYNYTLFFGCKKSFVLAVIVKPVSFVTISWCDLQPTAPFAMFLRDVTPAAQLSTRCKEVFDLKHQNSWQARSRVCLATCKVCCCFVVFF